MQKKKKKFLFCILFPTSWSYILPYEHHRNNIIFFLLSQFSIEAIDLQ